MTTSTCNDSDDREGRRPASRPGAIQAKVKTAVRCRLCRETIVLESNFRPTRATCPRCGLEFVFDPQREPLPVRGIRLRHSAVQEAQRPPGTLSPPSEPAGFVRHRRHSAHTHAVVRHREPRTFYLSWAAALALSLAAAAALYNGWFHRLWTR